MQVVGGVTLFIELSGFLLVYRHCNEDLSLNIGKCLKFGIDRIKKLYLVYIVTTFYFIALGIYQKNIVFDYMFVKNVLINIFLVQCWFPSQISNSYNNVAWYLSCVFLLYIIFPYINAVIKRYRNRRDAFFSIALLILLQFLYLFCLYRNSVSWYEWGVYTSPYYRIFEFLIGCNLGYLYSTRKIKENKNIIICVLTVTLLFFFCISHFYNVSKMQAIDNFLDSSTARFSLLAIPMIYAFSLYDGKQGKVFVIIGDLSNYGFLIHTIVIQLTFKILVAIGCDETRACAIVSFGVTLLISYVIKYIGKKGKGNKDDRKIQLSRN